MSAPSPTWSTPALTTTLSTGRKSGVPWLCGDS